MSIASRSGPIHRYRSVVTVTGIACAGLLVLTLYGCEPTRQERYERRLARTGAPAVHAVESARLRQIMNNLQNYPLPDQDVGLEQWDSLDRLATVAGEMRKSARAIPDAINEIDLPKEHRGVFLQLANKLADQAGELRERAQRRDVEGVKLEMERVQSTCNACHSLFRTERPVPVKPAKPG